MDALANRDWLIIELRSPRTKAIWDFRFRNSCVAGIIDHLMVQQNKQLLDQQEMADFVGLTKQKAARIFGIQSWHSWIQYRCRRGKVTSEMVAQALENVDGRKAA